ncbi:HK97 family phage prohead protease [Paraburkholderia youngii]|uniref:Peptidase U35 n=1 Tax=Paraburkholderia youngii TaxID=2782701 RepID=A0A7Y6K1R0_9BURK|nr:HK97 family phage prohead protease [Paraburkholderia youngii]NUY01558.1 peptidase U35 [Paraburkholderia youngii]
MLQAQPKWRGTAAGAHSMSDNLHDALATMRTGPDAAHQQQPAKRERLQYATALLSRGVDIDEDERIIEGVATSGSVDSYGDIVQPGGAEYTLPVPLLFSHHADAPVGAVIAAQRDDSCIRFRAQIARINTPGTLQDRCNEAWESVKAQLVRAVSIGFISLQSQPIAGGGRRHVKWRWCELSLVVLPANLDATIQSVRQLDEPEFVTRFLAEARAVRPLVRRAPARVVKLR